MPASALDGFGSDLAGQDLDILPAWQDELAQAKRDMVDLLYAKVHDSPPELRRFLLAVKRDCFNGRNLERHRSHPLWEALRGIAGPLVERILELERRIEHWQEEFESSFEERRRRERRHLIALLADVKFARGIALGIPLHLQDLSRLTGKDAIQPGSKEARLETILLRYVSRSARKLSPNSTLTRIALGRVSSEPEGETVALLGHGWRERSLLRPRTFLLDRFRDALLRHEPFRARLPVMLNDTLQEIAPGRFRLLRRGRWEVDESGGWSFTQDAIVKVSLGGPLFERLKSELSDRRPAYGKLIERLEREPAGEQAAQWVDRLLQLGVLGFIPPWTPGDERPEQRMLEHLRPLTPDLDCVVGKLERLVELEEGFAQAEDPAGAVREINRLLDEIWSSLAELSEIDAGAPPAPAQRGRFYEDVFLLRSEPGAEQEEIVRVSRAAVEEVAQTLQPLVRLSNLFNHRHDFLHSVAAFAARQWPGERELDLLELFSGVQPLWRQFLAFAAEVRQGGWRASFNPLGLREISELERLREQVWTGFASCLRFAPGEHRICGDAVTALLQDVPERFLRSTGSCFLLQPADAEGRLWMLNRMFEGIGRYGSRFTPAMDEAIRQRYTAHFASCSAFEQDGRQVELLDLMCAQGDTLNVHAVQTPRVLELPGELAGLPEWRRVKLRQLRVRLDDPSGVPVLVDASRRVCLPVHLGGANQAFMPLLVRFLAVFGPGEFLSVFPERPLRQSSEMRIWDRLTMGNVVLTRRRWFFPAAGLRERIRGLGDAGAFAEVNRWRRAWGLPERVFLLERVRHKILEDRYKPQYLDFTSPLFLEILRTSLAAPDELLALEEVLPGQEALPSDAAGTRWAVELMVDTLALGQELQSSLPRAARNDPFSQAANLSR